MGYIGWPKTTIRFRCDDQNEKYNSKLLIFDSTHNHANIAYSIII